MTHPEVELQAVTRTFENSARLVADRIDTLFNAIAHGDEAHRAWLKQAITDHFVGRPVQAEKKPLEPEVA